MASLRLMHVKTPPAWQVGVPNSTGQLYLNAGRWDEPDTRTPLPANQPVVVANFGPGHKLGMATGGAFAVRDPDDIPDDPGP